MTANSTADSSGTAPALTAPPDPTDVTDSHPVELTGLAPGQRVTPQADFGDRGAEWASEAPSEADADCGVWTAAPDAPAGLEDDR